MSKPLSKPAKDSFSFYRISEIIKQKEFDIQSFIKTLESFYIVEGLSPEYIEPRFSTIEGTIADSKTQIVLISAAGATGKSALSSQLSAKNKIPIIDLAKHVPVGGDSLSGLFMRAFGPTKAADFISKLTEGKSAIIIDALDEGRAKTKEEGFNAFLDNIIEYAKMTENISFIILGRTQVLEHSYLYFVDNGISTCLIKIEPFTIAQAKEFIDKRVKGTLKPSEIPHYEDVRDYIIKSIEGFFDNIKDIAKAPFNAFIGYAPVLKSIAILLTEEKNYFRLLGELKAKSDKGIDLIISIVKHILQREKTEKVDKQVLPELLKSYPDTFRQQVSNSAFGEIEQCARIISKLLNKKSNFLVSENENFNKAYEESISNWIEEHPFISAGKIQNPVFESFILATLIEDKNYEALAIEYLKGQYKDAYLLFFIYDKISRERKPNIQFIQYLYSSIKSLDDHNNLCSLSIESDEYEDQKITYNCDVEFVTFNSTDNKSNIYQFSLLINLTDTILFHGHINNISINVPCNISFIGQRLEICYPVNITCRKFIFNIQDFIIEKGIGTENELDNLVSIDCDEIEIDYPSGQLPSITDYVDKGRFQIYTSKNVQFPFSDYQSNKVKDKNIDAGLWERYVRLRRILMMLRSHSKGTLARFKDKVEHKRCLKNEIGRKILDSLVKDKILILQGPMYHWEPENASKYLGTSWNELKQKIITEKTKQYLTNI